MTDQKTESEQIREWVSGWFPNAKDLNITPRAWAGLIQLVNTQLENYVIPLVEENTRLMTDLVLAYKAAQFIVDKLTPVDQEQEGG